MSEHPTIENPEKRIEKEPGAVIPIIDLVRHGETEYKELIDENFQFDPTAQDFALDEAHLDLTMEGIKNIERTAEKLVQNINKQNELVLFVTSPQYRAVSSALIIEKVLRDNNIAILNPVRETKESPIGLGQISPRDKSFSRPWLEAHKKYGDEHPEARNKPPAELHALVATTFGKELSELFDKSHVEVTRAFHRFLRHLVNAGNYLQPETIQMLIGKKLRIIVVTHEERLMEFGKEALALEKTVAKGQMLELKPEGNLLKDGETQASAKLFGIGDMPDVSSVVKMGFSENGLKITKTSS